jgi:hypothetical protein
VANRLGWTEASAAIYVSLRRIFDFGRAAATGARLEGDVGHSPRAGEAGDFLVA